MSVSTLTKKGQVTIPKEIRNILGIKEHDKVMFVKKDGDIILKHISGDIFDLRGSLKPIKEYEDFEKIRNIARKSAAKKIIEESLSLNDE
ncbi:MAG: AbrB/MazE/SpoVT family DNA-binding domain-containing protein [Candidatus Acididesulfobacter guangdongensis]|uniref:AbrB/MazE/SpoVT family DNA-binding domain-containing protein n=1 Tax=Acididesulfobacter guangdongensis TaxID=2597225 RepID=A0A519BHX1_ACIG2|nr:MAG: AbrB/MazE/SpoVT family DNA-binding domain-containing protein [Candidatus Acididesulfobacter guangdongensis]